MTIERDARGGGPLVTGIGPAGFRVAGPAGEASHRALVMTVDAAQAWTPPSLPDLALDDLAMLVEGSPEFILLGTGATLQRPPAALIAALDARGIGIEAMDSRAAARAWGVLRGEGRRVAAALYPL